jgi:hypothetical protein
MQMDANKLKNAVGEITGVATEIESVLGTAEGGVLANPAIEKLTELFGNLIGLGIGALQNGLGQEVTPDSILKLLPDTTPLKDATA